MKIAAAHQANVRITAAYQAMKTSFLDIYNFKDENAKGRLISLGSALVTALYNVFITGIFYTGFLTMYDMSISDVGIIGYIPLLANCFCIFSPMILERIPKRKNILIASKIFFYALYIVATTLMPQFVHSSQGRLIWFAIILFVAHAVYALFSTGFTPWFYFFYPADNERRTRYITLNQIFSSIMSSATLLFSGVLTDALSGTPYEDTIILILRYCAFGLVLIDVFMQSRAIEYPYPKSQKINLLQVFTLPFKYRKFMLCLVFMFAWNFTANITALWSYHLLNHMKFSYTLINTMSVMYTVILVILSPLWRKVLRRYSWIKTFGIACLIWLPTEPLFALMTRESTYLYVPLSICQNILSVGLNLSYSNILYMNLPEENSTAHIAFYTIGCNLFAFFGQLVGTWISSISGDTPIMLWGLEIYTVQFNPIIRTFLLLAIGLVCVLGWKHFTPQRDIDEIEANALAEQKLRKMGIKRRKIRV